MHVLWRLWVCHFLVNQFDTQTSHRFKTYTTRDMKQSLKELFVNDIAPNHNQLFSWDAPAVRTKAAKPFPSDDPLELTHSSDAAIFAEAGYNH